MSSSKIEELKRKRQQEIGKKKSQIPYAFIFIILATIIYFLILSYDFEKSWFWLFGIMMGFVLERARFCFAAAFRDPVLVGNTSILRAIILGLILATVGFGVIQYLSIIDSQNFDINHVPGQIYPVGIHTIVGAIIFGIGMVIAGGCVSGTLMRIGEGFMLQLVVLFGLIIGTTLGARDFGFWDRLFISNSSIIYLPKYLGFPFAIITQIVVLIILYFIANWYDKKNNIMMM